MRTASRNSWNRTLAVFALGLASLLLALSGRNEGIAAGRRSPSSPVLATDLCPYRTPEEWQAFLNRYANNEKWVETCEDSTCDEDFYEYVKEGVEDTFDKCAGFLASHPRIDRCTRNLRRFTPAWLHQHDADSYGFNVSNHAYLADEESAKRPVGMMKLPPELVAALPDRAKVEAVARAHGWKYLTHDSALDGTRTFILVSDPQGKFDKWMLLNLASGASPSIKENTPLSVLAVQKKDAEGNTLPKVVLHFRDYTISRPGGHTHRGYQVTLNESNNGKCYSCHVSGVRQLIARKTPVMDARPVLGEPGYDPNDALPDSKEFGYLRLLEFNRRLRSYGMPDWEGKVSPEDHGPALGEAQGCLDCHDGETRGALTVFTSPSQLEKKIYYELSMPSDTGLPKLLERSQMKDPALTPDEKIALEKAFAAHDDLTRDFESSRFPMLKQWFLETPCR